MDQDQQNRVNVLEGEVETLETVVAELVTAMVSNQLVDADLLRTTTDESIVRFTVRQHDDLIMGTPGEHYFKGAIQVLEKLRKGLP